MFFGTHNHFKLVKYRPTEENWCPNYPGDYMEIMIVALTYEGSKRPDAYPKIVKVQVSGNDDTYMDIELPIEQWDYALELFNKIEANFTRHDLHNLGFKPGV